MKTDRNILLILAFALAFFAAWRIFSYRATHGERNPAVVENLQQAVANKSAELLKDNTLSSSQEGTNQPITYAEDDATAPSYAGSTTAATATTDVSSTKHPSSEAVRTPVSAGTKQKTSSTYQSAASVPTAARTTTKPASTYSSQKNAYTPSMREQIEQERYNNLSPYLVPNKEAQKKLDTNFKDLNSAIARAVQSALMPKSKKNANIEKYLHKDGATASSAAADPFQEMLTQFSAEKKDIVQNVTNAFGKSAGQRAEQLMDNFQKDLTAEVSKTDQPLQTTAQNVQKIANKYQQKFDQMNQQNQYNQYVKELTAQYNNQVKALKELYPGQDKLNNELAHIAEEALKKDLSLSAQNMTPEEYTKARYDIQYKMHQEMEDAIKKSGNTLTGLHQYDNERAKQILDDLQNKEEAGAIVSVPRKADEADIKALSNTLLDEQNKMLSQIEQAYGAQALADFKPALNNYYQQMMKTMQQPMSAADRYQAQMNLRTQYNRQILEMQRNTIANMDIPQEQKDAALATIDKEISALPKM